ncbi:MAG: hypothetical protein RLZZ426_711 [Actinomycetota bacterium]
MQQVVERRNHPIAKDFGWGKVNGVSGAEVRGLSNMFRTDPVVAGGEALADRIPFYVFDFSRSSLGV